MKNLKLTLLSILTLVGLISCAEQPLKVLVISGQTGNGHSWEVMAKSLEEIYAGCEVFDAHIALMGELGDKFNPDFSNYDVVVMTISLAVWSDELKSRFEDYVTSGGGVVAVHEGASAFPEWEAYNRMMGINGWAGRNENMGDYLYWLDGEFVTDDTPGVAGKHGRRVPFDINVRSENHPIMSGLPKVWTQYDEELYGNLRGHAENMEVLATAFSTLESGGTGREEPVMMTINYGQGRIFHTVLGHTQQEACRAHENPSFPILLLRASEWAARGEVRRTAGLNF